MPTESVAQLTTTIRTTINMGVDSTYNWAFGSLTGPGNCDHIVRVKNSDNSVLTNTTTAMAASVWWGGYTPIANTIQPEVQPEGSFSYMVEIAGGNYFLDEFDKALTTFSPYFWGDGAVSGSGPDSIIQPSSVKGMIHSNGKHYIIMGSAGTAGGKITVIDTSVTSGVTFSPIRAYVYMDAGNINNSGYGPVTVWINGDTVYAAASKGNTFELISFDPSSTVTPNVPSAGFKCITTVTRTTGFPVIATNANHNFMHYDSTNNIMYIGTGIATTGFEPQQGIIYKVDVPTKTILTQTPNFSYTFDTTFTAQDFTLMEFRRGFVNGKLALLAYNANPLLINTVNLFDSNLNMTTVSLSTWESLVPFTHTLPYSLMWADPDGGFFVDYADSTNFSGDSPLVRFTFTGGTVSPSVFVMCG